MSRVRSKTIDSSEAKKKGLPWRLNEKIALMKEKEQAQSEAFEQAMKSIFEMQQARIHPGGGSMPSLQLIDNNTQYTATNGYTMSVDENGCLTTPTTVTTRERPHSGGPGGRNIIERTQSYDNPTNSTHANQYWNTMSNEWLDNDLSRHKSDSDLQQSLLMDSQLLGSPSYPTQSTNTPLLTYPPSSTPPSHFVHLINPSFTTSSPVTAAGVDKHHLKLCNHSTDVTAHWDNSNKVQPNNRLGSSVSAALLSPDYPNITSNPDINSMGGASSLPDLTNVEFSCGLDVPIEDDDSPTYKANSFHYPSSTNPGPSRLTYSSLQAAPPNVSLISVGGGGVGQVHHHPVYMQQSVTSPPINQNLPEYRNSHHPSVRKLRPIIPAPSNYSPPYQSTSTGNTPASNTASNNSAFTFKLSSHGIHSINGMTPPTISLETSPPAGTPPYSLPYMTPPSSHQHAPPLLSPPSVHTIPPDNSMFYGATTQQQGGASNYGYASLPPYLDPGLIYQRQMLQQKMAGMNFSSTAPLRSHSEENLLTTQKDMTKTDDIQENPFMGNMCNANSVPCVYVEPSSTDPCIDTVDSPTTGTGSPSTSASHASSPPLIRPIWLDHPHSMNDYVFHEWPMDTAGDKIKFGSPLSHHKSLTELNKLATDAIMELSPNSQNKSHQLSLPSIVMNDLLIVDEQFDKNLDLNAEFLPAEFEMEEEVMESLLRDDGFVSFDNVDFIHQHHNF